MIAAHLFISATYVSIPQTKTAFVLSQSSKEQIVAHRQISSFLSWHQFEKMLNVRANVSLSSPRTSQIPYQEGRSKWRSQQPLIHFKWLIINMFTFSWYALTITVKCKGIHHEMGKRPNDSKGDCKSIINAKRGNSICSTRRLRRYLLSLGHA